MVLSALVLSSSPLTSITTVRKVTGVLSVCSTAWEPKLFWGARGGPWPWLESYVRAQKAAVWIERQSFQKSLKPDPAQAPCSEPSRQSTCGQDSVGSTGCPAHRWLTCCDAALAAACSAAFAASRPDRLSAAFAAATSRSIVLGFTPTALAILRLLICGSAALNQRGVALARSGASAAPG